MSERHDFIRAIQATPRDDVPRLVYADWLEEQNENERAEFIRLQIEQARRGDYSHDERPPSVAGLGQQTDDQIQGRIDELLVAQQETWREEFPEVGTLGGDFVRGFVETIHWQDNPSTEMIQRIQHFFAQTPGRTLYVQSIDETGLIELLDWVNSGAAQTIESLTFGAEALPNDRSWVLLHREADWPALRRLRFEGGFVLIEGEFAVLLALPIVQRLTHAAFTENYLNDRDVYQLVHPNLENLVELDLSNNYIDDPGIATFMSSPHWKSLRSLRLRNNIFGAPAVTTIVNSPVYPQLRQLDLSGCEGLDNRSAEVLVQHPATRTLLALNVNETTIRPAMRRQLAESIAVSTVTEPSVRQLLADIGTPSDMPNDVLAVFLPHEPIGVSGKLLAVTLLICGTILGFYATVFKGFDRPARESSDTFIAAAIACLATLWLIVLQPMLMREWVNRRPLLLGFGAAIAGGFGAWFVRPDLPGVWFLAVAWMSVCLAPLLSALLARVPNPMSRIWLWLLQMLVPFVFCYLLLASLSYAADAARPFILHALIGIFWLGCAWGLGMHYRDSIVRRFENGALNAFHSGTRNQRYLDLIVSTTAIGAFFGMRVQSEFSTSYPSEFWRYTLASACTSLGAGLGAVLLSGNPTPLARRSDVVDAAYSRRERQAFVPLIIGISIVTAMVIVLAWANRSPSTFAEHPEAVTAIDADQQGLQFVTGCRDGNLRIWDAQGRLLSTVMAHRGGVNAVRYLKGAQSIVSAGADGTLKLWSRDGEPQGELTPPERLQFAPATFLDVDSDGKTIWAMQGNRLVAYDVTTKQGTLDDVWLPIVQRVREEVRKEKPAPLPVSLPYIWTARRNTMLIAHDTLNGKWVGEYNRLGELLGSPHIIRESPRQLGYFADGRILCVTGDGFQSFPSSLNPMSPVTAASSDAERWTWPGQWPKDPQLLTGEGNHVRRVQLR